MSKDNMDVHTVELIENQAKRIKELEAQIIKFEAIPEHSVIKPKFCPFQDRNEETNELWCGYDDQVNCDNEEYVPQGCPLLKSPIKIVII